MAVFELKSVQFRREREESWRELEKLVVRAEKGGLGALSAPQLARLPTLYKATLSSLSVARSISLDRALIDYLEALCGRAYLIVYRPRRNFLRALSDFILTEFPQAVRDTSRSLLVATLIFFVGVIVAHVQTMREPERYYTFVPEGLVQGRGPDSTPEELREVLYGGDEQSSGNLAAFAAFLFKHNASIGLACFALGGLAGIPVILLVFKTGLMLGGFTAIHAQKGLTFELLGWLLPHGITEILAVLLCAAAGLHIGHALIFPGRSLRRDSVMAAGRLGGKVALGSLILFIAAGLIEGIFRQRVQSDLIRYAFATTTALVWIIYFGFVGRGRR